MNNTKQTIIRLLFDTEREGTEYMIEYLDRETDFFEAPASTRHHCAYVGGLAQHSLNVYNTMLRLDNVFTTCTPDDKIAVVALLHDVCKTNFYVQEQAWRKDDRGKWESYIRWGVTSGYSIGKAYNAAVDKYPLVTLLATADNLATHLIEKENTL